ncbi:hypothetical protein GCM10010129_68080 [Streptomyces fumigatiscleroticus]|nr:hypothetical protein GCM10010129_68080 [Streptomyces fumigatiscleroticus]
MSALRHALARTDGPTTAALTAVLAALWSTDSNRPRLAALAADTGPLLSHYHPEPEYVEATRAATVLCMASLFMVFMDYGPHTDVTRHLVERRFPSVFESPSTAPPRTSPDRAPPTRSARLDKAVATVTGAGVLTRDVGGTATTEDVTEALIDALDN